MPGDGARGALQILQVPPRKLCVRDDLDLSISLLIDNNCVTQISDTVVDLDLVMEEFFEGGNIKDLVRSGLRCVDDKLREIR